MKGIPTLGLKRLKRAAVVAGIGALVVGGSVLGTSQAHAAGQFGSGTGLTITPATGQANTKPTYSSAACPSGFQGSAALEVIDPTTPAGTTFSNIPHEQVTSVNTQVSNPFTGSWTETVDSEPQNGLNISTGTQFEVAVYCYTSGSATGPGEFASSTFMTINAGGTYTANQTVTGPSQSVNLVLTASPNPAVAGQPVTLTATATPAGATGTVQFENNGTNINAAATISGGVATTSTTFAAAATENLTAVYTPTGNFTAGTAGALTLTVGAAPANSGTIPLAVTVPVSGSFSLTVDTTDVVTLTATGLTATGTTTPIIVMDTRNNYPGWSVTGQDSSWTGTGTAAGGTFSGNQLGWTPTGTNLPAGVTLGPTVAPVTPGLGTTPALLASAHAGLGNGFGTTTLGATLNLVIPPSAPAGPYTSGLTITAATSNP